MANEVLSALVRLSIVATLGVLVMIPLRKPLRRAVGTEAAYWLWLFLPGSLLAVFLPRASAAVCGPDTLLSPVVNNCAMSVTLIWSIGAVAALACFAYCQWLLRRSLGRLQERPDGTHWSPAARQPMLIGGWRPKIVLPGDFETRYSLTERALVLAHERAHLARNDALTNTLASAIVCLFWFNPLVYWAWNRFRFDQEVACDAAVLRQSKLSRRCYAQALAKTHVVGPAAIAFGWQRRHPLIERIAILKRPAPSRTRRLMGYALALGLMLSGVYAVWSSVPGLPGGDG
jgi:bla regulator protein blaR1